LTRPYYPVALNLVDKPVLVVGGGAVAEGKVEGLLEAGALVTVVSPTLTGRLLGMAAQGRFAWRQRPFEVADVEGAWIVIAATDDVTVNARVADAARGAGRLVNAVDDVPNCDFIATSIVRRGDVQISISTGGGSPAMARWLREQLDAALPAELGDLLDAVGEVRAKLKAKGAVPPYAAWKAAIEAALSPPLSPGEAENRSMPGQDGAGRPHHRSAEPGPHLLSGHPLPGGEEPRRGTVYLVGAGPGDPGLLTLRAVSCLAGADAVVYDQLVDDGVLRLARPDARLIYVGKRPGRHHAEQDEINRMLVELAREGLAVVRLKGGDPFVFGRGGEEALALRQAGVPFEVVPGVSSALAAPAAAGIPVTHRGRASAVTGVTGHECGPDSSVDWDVLGRSGATLVVLMGMGNLPRIVDRLLAAGRSPDEPVAVVQNATRHDQRVLRASLAAVAGEAAAAGLGSPAVIVVGAVAELGDVLPPQDVSFRAQRATSAVPVSTTGGRDHRDGPGSRSPRSSE
jgi:uroporphyrin-III C-methyltransferase/precorrin-2 dehydrogenase/sirohydrochlorin ferrochelatase